MLRHLPPLLAALCALLPTAAAQDTPAERLAAHLAAAHAEGHFTGAALVADGGEVLWKGAAGLANREWELPNTADTRFRLGSITKQFTAVLILMLAEEGRVELEAPLLTYLPDYREDTGSRVTIHHLLNHTLGIPSYTSQPGFFEAEARHSWEVGPFVAQWCSGDLEFEPGSAFRYNNSGYHLLGAVIEAVTGKAYDEVVEERIFGPLDMTASGYDWNEEIVPRRATGYRPGGGTGPGGWRIAEYLDMSIPYAAGALYSTVEDLYRWDRALDGEELLSAASKELLFRPGLSNYAYGWGIQGEGDALLHAHGGGIFGFRTMIVRRPATDTLVVALCNAENAQPSRVVQELLEILDAEPRAVPVREASGFQFTEGPAADGAGNLYFTDLTTDRVLVRRPDGQVDVVLEASEGCNGLMVAADGRLVACQGEAGRLVALDPESGALEVLAHSFGDAPLNKPNDLVLDSAGGIYFSDPDFPGGPGTQEVEAVYYLDFNGALHRTAAAFEKGRRPNGVLLSPDEQTLYLLSSRSPELLAYPVEAPGELGEAAVLAVLPSGGDGLAVDAEGRLYVTQPRESAVLVIAPDGEVLERIEFPEGPANCAFGGPDLRTLYVTARTSLYSLPVAVPGHRFDGAP